MSCRNKLFWGTMSVFLILALLLISFYRVNKNTEKYETLFYIGEGMYYRSFVFETSIPTRNPYPVKFNDMYAYSRNMQGSHVEQVTEPVFQMAKLFTNDLGAVKTDGKWGYIRLFEGEYKSFEYAIPLSFDGAEPFSEGLAAVKQNDKYGYIDLNGELVIEPEFVSAHYFSGGLAAVESETGWYFIDRVGNIVLQGPYEGAESFTVFSGDEKFSLAAVKLNGKWGYIDMAGRVVIKPTYDDAWAFDNFGRAAVKRNGKWFFINTSGERI
jgi:hypothetical protein